MSTKVVWWVTRDLRLFDNPVLQQALAESDEVIPLFLLDEHLKETHEMARGRNGFLLAGQRQLDHALRQIGSRLIIRRGKPADFFPGFLNEVGGSAVYVLNDPTPYCATRDQAVAEKVPLNVVNGFLIRPEADVRKKDGSVYTVFTPYKKRWLSHPLPHRRDLLPAPEKISTSADIASKPFPGYTHPVETDHFPSGEAEGRRRLHHFVDRSILNYAEQRNYPAVAGTAALSPYLHFGMVSAREAAVLALEKLAEVGNQNGREGVETWLSELIWREFYNVILINFPHVEAGNFRSEYDRVAWLDDTAGFEAWCKGETGYPLVDAAMRELNNTGWMHNRARMVVASFLVKDLLIDWRWGERYFMEKLVDGDLAANNGGWQWAAGTGTDAAPYFRIFNPVSQSKKFDAAGEYIRKWVPELSKLGNKEIHAPWEIKPLEQKMYGVVIDRDYPAPIVNHKMARERTLAAYKKARGGG